MHQQPAPTQSTSTCIFTPRHERYGPPRWAWWLRSSSSREIGEGLLRPLSNLLTLIAAVKKKVYARKSANMEKTLHMKRFDVGRESGRARGLDGRMNEEKKTHSCKFRLFFFCIGLSIVNLCRQGRCMYNAGYSAQRPKHIHTHTRARRTHWPDQRR